jgi:hypothetical protein
MATFPALASEPLTQCLVTGCIDWSASTIDVIGVAAPTKKSDSETPTSPSEILDAAWRMAQSNLIKTASAIQIDATTRVADRLAQSDAFREGLEALAQNASITDQEYLSDGTLKVTLTMSLIGGFTQFVLPHDIRHVEPVTTMMSTTKPTDDSSRATDNSEEERHSGLIIDASGIGAKPSIVPEVIDEAGEVVYGPAFVSREFAVSRGMCGFATSVKEARKNKQIGNSPLIVKALRTVPRKETNIVISNIDAARLRSSVVHLNLLKACRVSIVMDPLPGP